MTICDSRGSPHERRLCRFAVTAAALCVFVGMAVVWTSGFHSAGIAILRFFGVEPGAIPFLDTHAILAAAECRQRGVDVYLSNPCDILGRPHVYSPLWLTLVPGAVATTMTPWIGAFLDLLFILALPALMSGRGWRESAVMTVAVFSPVALYAVERANNDLVVFLLVLVAGLMMGAARRWRLAAYAVLVGAALLKYYPAVLLVLVARERRRDALIVAAGAAAALGVFAASYHDVLREALSNSARLASGLSYYTDSFSARNLPLGLATGLARLHAAGPFAFALFAVLAGLALARVRRTARLLDAAGIEWTGRGMRLAAIGGLLVAACFLVAQNIGYRAIYLLFVLPGVVQSWRTAANPAARRFLGCMLAAMLFVMWEECFRRGLLAALDAVPSERVPMVFWVVRELVWWWLFAALAGLVSCYLARLPLCREGAAWLERVCPSLGNRLPPMLRANPAVEK